MREGEKVSTFIILYSFTPALSRKERETDVLTLRHWGERGKRCADS